ncbi:MAG: FAD-dependent oxidoreductase [Vicinamibacterales bacterium]
MTRDVARLGARTFDLLVIGGGIYGLTVAADAAQRGLSVALVEGDDFGSGNSFNHLRTIHGGLRYLQSLDVARARESVRERRTLARVAPQFVRPLPFVLPLTSLVMKGPLMLRAGFLFDALVAHDRNAHLPESHRLPRGQVIGPAEARDRFPWLRGTRMYAAAVWHDYVVTEADRLTLAWAFSAAEHGATLVNHARAQRLLRQGDRIVGARVDDLVEGRSIDVAAQVTVNATGGDLDTLLTPEGLQTGTPMLQAMNLVTRLDGGAAAIGAQTASGRALFMVPWRGRALFGTWESPTVCGPSRKYTTEADLSAFIREVASAYPQIGLTRDDVTLVHRGMVPAAVTASGRVSLEGRQQLRDHATAAPAVEGLISVAGTKYTTARAAAEAVTDRVVSKLSRQAGPCRTSLVPLPRAARTGLEPSAASPPSGVFPADVREQAMTIFGDLGDRVLGLADERPDLAARVSHPAVVVAAQIVWAVRHEMAVTLADAVLRRTPLGALGHPGRPALMQAAAIMAAELGWDEARVSAEIDAVDAFYR